MKKITMLAALFLTLTALFLGCDEGMTVVKPVLPGDEIQEPGLTETPITMGEVKVPEGSVVPEPTPPAEIRYYRDADLTEPVTGTVEIGTVLYTLVTFSEEVPVVVSDGEDARPSIFFTTRPSGNSRQVEQTSQYCMKPEGSDLRSGDAMPYRDSFLCKYVVGTEDFAKNLFTHTDASEGDPLKVILYSGELHSLGAYSFPVRQHPNDFTGVVCAFLQHPVAGVTVTIMTGPRSGESVTTGPNGQYVFSNIAADELHLRVEKQYFEPKEVIIFRDRHTILANGAVPNFQERPKDPGFIQIGQRWPDEIRPVLESTLLVHDLLYYEGSSLLGEQFSAVYISSDGEILLNTKFHSQTVDPAGTMLQALAHELAHAHQHALVSIDGSSRKPNSGWLNTPEGKAFAEARKKDLEEFGKVEPYDTHPHYEWPHENAAEVCAYYWVVYPRGMAHYTKLEDVAPHRFKWAEEWLGKK